MQNVQFFLAFTRYDYENYYNGEQHVFCTLFKDIPEFFLDE